MRRIHKKSIFSKILRAMLILASLAVLYICFIAYSIWSYGNVDERRSADAAIVLGAAAWHDNPSPVFRERIRHGVWLFEEGYVDFIIFTGGYGTGAAYSEAYVARDYAIAMGVPEEKILIEEYSRNTEDHFSYARTLIEENNIETVILVSDPLHMKRAVRMARDSGLVAYSSPTPTTRYQTLSTQLPFLRQEVIHYIGYRIFNLLP